MKKIITIATKSEAKRADGTLHHFKSFQDTAQKPVAIKIQYVNTILTS